jgi:hypothetical protein
MDSRIFCPQARCATITIKIGGKIFKFLSKLPPVQFVGITKKNLFISANKTNLIDLEMPFSIASLRWVSNGSDFTGGNCPRTEAEGMRFSGNKLNIYPAVPGIQFQPLQCLYEVGFTGQKKLLATFSDQTGEIYSIESDDDSLDYSVECDDCCDQTDFLCASSNYPGWKCVPLAPIADRLDSMRSQIRLPE